MSFSSPVASFPPDCGVVINLRLGDDERFSEPESFTEKAGSPPGSFPFSLPAGKAHISLPSRGVLPFYSLLDILFQRESFFFFLILSFRFPERGASFSLQFPFVAPI